MNSRDLRGRQESRISMYVSERKVTVREVDE